MGHPDKEPVTLPAGATVYLPVWWIQRSELNFHAPLAFDPERFMPQNKQHIHRYAFLASSGPDGPQDCMGRDSFFMLELLCVFVSLLRHQVQVQPLEGYELDPEKRGGTVQQPEGGVPLFVSTKR